VDRDEKSARSLHDGDEQRLDNNYTRRITNRLKRCLDDK
jgi:hypothetical protein